MFKVTDRAKVAIARHLADSAHRLIPMITWAYMGKPENGSWTFGYAHEDQLLEVSQEIVRHVSRQIAEMEFIVDGPAHWEHLLEGRTLDFIDGQFLIIPSAAHPSSS
jgi:hypothetical protein